jgi:hypothetical protein
MNAMQTIVLDSGASRALRVAYDSFLIVRAGGVWLTLEGDAADYWLAPGDRFPLFAGVAAWIGGWKETVRCELAPLALPVDWPDKAGARRKGFGRGLRAAIRAMAARFHGQPRSALSVDTSAECVEPLAGRPAQ